MSRDDRYVSTLTNLSATESEYFFIKAAGYGTRTFNFYTRYLATFTLSHDLEASSRTAPSLIILLANCGGLATILFSMAAWMTGVLSFNTVENRLVT